MQINCLILFTSQKWSLYEIMFEKGILFFEDIILFFFVTESNNNKSKIKIENF